MGGVGGIFRTLQLQRLSAPLPHPLKRFLGEMAEVPGEVGSWCWHDLLIGPARPLLDTAVWQRLLEFGHASISNERTAMHLETIQAGKSSDTQQPVVVDTRVIQIQPLQPSERRQAVQSGVGDTRPAVRRRCDFKNGPSKAASSGGRGDAGVFAAGVTFRRLLLPALPLPHRK